MCDVFGVQRYALFSYWQWISCTKPYVLQHILGFLLFLSLFDAKNTVLNDSVYIFDGTFLTL